ncbi:MAG: HIT domain-containing protein [bacterium]
MNFIIENEYFVIEHCHSCAVPGYLIVSPTTTVDSINELPISFQQQLGFSLAAATKVIQETIDPLKVYCAQFGEEGVRLHFHIFPRTSKITTEFLMAFPDQKDLIHGPVLLDWAREEYKYNKENVWSIVSPLITEMRKRITMPSIGSLTASRLAPT